jgi:ribose 5-phosphate isomerase B
MPPRHTLIAVASTTRRRILTAEDVQAIPEGGILDIAPGTLLTDIAREWVQKRKIRLVERAVSTLERSPARMAIGSDHGGFDMKESLKRYLRELPATFIDYGTHSKDAVDYPDFAHAVALAVAVGHAQQGIVIDGAGIGSAIVANKVPGVRAGACYDEAGATNAREHNDINVMTLGSTLMAADELAQLVHIFMTAQHTESRHRARVAKITDVEKRYYRKL